MTALFYNPNNVTILVCIPMFLFLLLIEFVCCGFYVNTSTHLLLALFDMLIDDFSKIDIVFGFSGAKYSIKLNIKMSF